MHRKNGGLFITILILVLLYEAVSLIPVFSPLPPAAGEKKTSLLAVVPHVPLLEIKRDWAKTPAFPPPNAFAASPYMQALLRDIVHEHNKEIAVTSEAANGATFTMTIPVTAIAAGEEPTWS